MPQIDRVGTWGAMITSCVVNETGDNKLTTLIIEMKIDREAQPDGEGKPQWVDVAAEGLYVTQWLYLEKKNGSLNTMSIDQARQALGWEDGIGWFEENDVSGEMVQVTTKEETYQGKQQIRAGWLSKYDSAGPTSGGGNAEPADADTMRRMKGRMDSKLRAIAGGTQQKPTAVPEKPTAPDKKTVGKVPPKGKPAKKAPPAPAAADEPAGESTLEDAWGVFVAACPEKWDDATVQQNWYDIMAHLIPDKRQQDFTPADWHRMQTEGVELIEIPF